jgi:uncharacterized GH25 family protein
MLHVIPRFSLLLVFVVALSWGDPAQAHDYWMKPDITSAVQPGADLDVRMWLGDKLNRGEEEEHRPKKAKLFVHVTSAGTVDLKGRTREGATPLIALQNLSAGGHMVALTRSASHITLPGWKFSTYLLTEEFEDVVSARKASGATWSAGKERYRRYLKSLIQVGAATDSVFGSVLGQKYEIILLANPMTLGAGQSLPVRVEFDGQPAPGVRVVARSSEHKGSEGRTDSSGVAKLPLSGRGEWLIRSVQMRPCSGSEKADWESFWASYHFIQF